MKNLNIILFDGEERKELLPLTYTRPVGDLRVGILKIVEKWELALGKKISFITEDYLSEKFKLHIEDDNLLINGSLLPNSDIIDRISDLEKDEALLAGESLLAVRMNRIDVERLNELENFDHFSITDMSDSACVIKINHLWDLFQMNDSELRNDFQKLTKGKTSEKLSSSNTIIGNGDVFVEKGAKVEATILNCSSGPIFISKNSEIMEGSMIRGPFFLGEYSTVKMGAKIYGATSIGEHCKVGGEINNVIFQSYSNKGHDGFLGNAFIGEWCNIGADTNNSNLKNNYADVKIWNYAKEGFVSTKSIFCGLFMGDHSKVGINTTFNTGTVVGVSANIFGPGFPRVFIPSFSWGGNHGFSTFMINKAFDTAEVMMKRRDLKLTDVDKEILSTVYKISSKYRVWEKK